MLDCPIPTPTAAFSPRSRTSPLSSRFPVHTVTSPCASKARDDAEPFLEELKEFMDDMKTYMGRNEEEKLDYVRRPVRSWFDFASGLTKLTQPRQHRLVSTLGPRGRPGPG